MTTAIDTLEDRYTAVQEQAAEYLEREDFDPDDPGYKALTAEADTLTRAIKERSDWSSRKAVADDATTIVRRAAARATATRDEAMSSESAGDIFTRSQQFQGYHGYGSSGRVNVGDTLERALPMKVADFASGLVAGNRFLADAPLLTPLLDLIPTVQTSLGSFPVWGITQTAGTDATDSGAKVVAEGADKPSIEFAESKIDVALVTIAVWTQLTRQALEDVPMLRSTVDTALRRNVLREFEKAAVAGILAGTTATAAAPAGGTIQHAIRIGVAAVQAQGWNPNAVLINPADTADVDIASLSNSCCGDDNFWGLRVVPSNDVAAGEPLVGDFSNGATTYARSAGVDVFITDSHADTFIQNVFTILAETRRQTVVERADAFVKVSVTP